MRSPEALQQPAVAHEKPMTTLRSPSPLCTCAVSLALVSIAAAGGSGGSLHLLGSVGLTPTDVSDDGRVVVGYNLGEFWYWTAEQGIVPIGGVSPSAGGAGSAGVSGDGVRIGFTTLNPQTGKTEGAFYDIVTGLTKLVGNFGHSCDSAATSCWGVSGDGSTMVGLGWHAGCAARGYRFTDANGLFDLGSVVPGQPSRANACNVDGTVIVGWQDSASGARQATVWFGGEQRLLATPNGSPLGEAGAVSADGVWVVGQGTSANGFRGWRWSVASGYQPLPPSPIPTLPRAFPTAVSKEGSQVLLFYRTQFPPSTGGEGYLWSAGTVTPLETVAAQAGIDIPPDVRLSLPLGMSGDGYTIVGTARVGSGVQGFVLDLPRPVQCRADFNGDLSVDGDDLGVLLGTWGSCQTGPCPADLTLDGMIDGDDLGLLLGAWGQCPAG